LLDVLKDLGFSGSKADVDTLLYSNDFGEVLTAFGSTYGFNAADFNEAVFEKVTGKTIREQAAEDMAANGNALSDYEVAYEAVTPGTTAAPSITNISGTTTASYTAPEANAAGTIAGKGLGADKSTGTGEGLVFQIGANGVEDQRITLNVKDMSSTALGVAGVSVALRDEANAAIDIVDKAVNAVSMQRAGLGAMQNRLEHTANNLTTTNENLTAAEAAIRDTDMATEMINYTKFNILQQSAQAMLAQANQAPQSVLQLLG